MNDKYVLVINNIEKLLTYWCYLVQLKNSNLQFDINKESENVVKELLNCLDMGHFRNCNDEEKNAKGIDLIDDEQSLGIQVTVNQSSSKIINTLDKSIGRVKKAKMFYLATKLDNHREKTFENYPNFDLKSDRLFLENILRMAKSSNKEIEVLSILNKYFGESFNDIENTKLENTETIYTLVETNQLNRKTGVNSDNNYGISKDIVKQFDDIENYLFRRLLLGEKQRKSNNTINDAMLKIMDWIIGDRKFPSKKITKLYNGFDNSLLKVNEKNLKSRHNALIAFFSGNINKTNNIYNQLFNQIDNINDKWFRDDILIDGRNIIWRIETSCSGIIKNKYTNKIDELKSNIQYPTIDRLEKDTINNVISKSIEYKYKSRYTEVYGIGLEESFQNIQRIIYNAVLYGSITQLNVVRGTIARILIIYANATDDKYMYQLALKFFVLCNDYKKFKNIANKVSLDNREIESKEYANEILKLRKSKLAYDIDYFDIFTFEFYGRLIDDKDFSINENRILNILKSKNVSKINSTLKAIPNNIVRLNRMQDLLNILKTLAEKGADRQIQDILQYIEYAELNHECQIVLKDIISIILKQKNYNIIYSLLLDIKEIEKTNEYDDILYNSDNEYIINRLNGNNEFSVNNFELVLRKISERNKETIKTGIISGYANDYIIFPNYFEKDTEELRRIIESNLFPLVSESLESAKITYHDKIKLLRSLMYVYYFDNNYIEKIRKILDKMKLSSSDDMFSGGVDERYLKVYIDYFKYVYKDISLNQLLKKYINISYNSYIFEEIRIILNEVFTNEHVDDCCFNILSILISNMLESDYEGNRVNAIRLSKILYETNYFNDIYNKLYDISISARYNEMREMVILISKLEKNDKKVIALTNNIINNANYNIRYMCKKYLSTIN